jgi:glycosyltransferase involved in cell wall biosynthesis
MKISVIVSTYNSPAWLEKVLWGLQAQCYQDFELVIADDGSSAATQELISRYKPQVQFSLTHVWHKDKGFRKCEIVNKAILKANGDYLVFLDGDCIPHPDFLRHHALAARTGCFLVGGFIRLSMQISEQIQEYEVSSGICFDYPWLLQQGLKKDSKNKRLRYSGRFAAFMDAISLAPKSFKGGNSSAWKKDLIAANGFDHRMPWGGEDRELGIRLKNAGLSAVHVRYRAVILHLDHPRSYVDPAAVKRNRELRIETAKQKHVQTQYGINLLTKG